MRTEVLCISVLRVASGPRVNLTSCKNALTPTTFHPSMVYSTKCSKAVVPVLVLLKDTKIFQDMNLNLNGLNVYKPLFHLDLMIIFTMKGILKCRTSMLFPF